MSRAPGSIRDAIVRYLSQIDSDASLQQIRCAVADQLGEVSPSSVRSYLNLNVPGLFERTGRGRYCFKKKVRVNGHGVDLAPVFIEGKAKLVQTDCFEWLAQCEPLSIHAVVTDPPYGLVEYTEKEQIKLRNGRGGVWRIPPSYDGHKRAPLPRFTVLDDSDRKELYGFFKRLGQSLGRAMVPGANVVIASNALLSHIVASAMAESGFELRGHIVRLTMTMRGGDRPKNAHREFDGVSVMPRSMWEPWVVLRKPLDGRVQDNLRRWKTGGFRRPSKEQPFGDVIRSGPTPKAERKIAPHPSLKPQDFLRRVVHAVLPLGEGVVLDPFAGSGSALAAANAVGYCSIGLEKDPTYFQLAQKAVRGLAGVRVNNASSPLTLVRGSRGTKVTKGLEANPYREGGRLR